MQVEYGESATEFIPYKSSEARIPLSQPMYDGDYVYIKDGELWVHRENGVAVFDGSEDGAWGYSVSENVPFVYIEPDPIAYSPAGYGYCNILNVKKIPVAHASEMCVTVGNNIFVANPGVSDANEWKTWLQSNPMTIVYDLATPVEEKITSAEPYTLRTYTPQTRIWTPDELKPDIEVDIPKNLAGGYATDGYAQAMKNQAATAEQEAIKARLLSLEQLAIKEV